MRNARNDAPARKGWGENPEETQSFIFAQAHLRRRPATMPFDSELIIK
ncbi:MAG: hypothetical protein IPI63_01160 [Methanothrix sp.]|nr:hypothetical protein [Methanothrix sp.]MBK7385396.1 hypothetical protein [Methanothrix sp.]